MISKFINFITGILLLPVCAAVSIITYQELSNVGFIPRLQIYFFVGIGAYLVVHLFFFVPEKLYAFEHDIFNKFIGWISAGKLKGPAILPHLIPSYMILIAVIYWVLSLFFETMQEFTGFFIFLIGLSFAFHIIFTAQTMRSKEKDLFGSTYMTLICLIFIINMTLAALIFSFFFPEISMEEYFINSYYITKDVYLTVFSQLFG